MKFEDEKVEGKWTYPFSYLKNEQVGSYKTYLAKP